MTWEHISFGYGRARSPPRCFSEVKPARCSPSLAQPALAKARSFLWSRAFCDPWSGRLLIDGHDAKSLQLKDIRSQVAMVLQEPFLLPLSVAENIAYGRPGAPD